MNDQQMQNIHSLFEAENYLELYRSHAAAINEMLFISSQQEFEDFIESEGSLEEAIFWLYNSAAHGESLLVGGYEEDVTEKVSEFLCRKLPETEFSMIQGELQQIYVDIDGEDTLKETINRCNKRLDDTTFLIQVDFEDTYCAGAYFVSIMKK